VSDYYTISAAPEFRLQKRGRKGSWLIYHKKLRYLWYNGFGYFREKEIKPEGKRA
jgi:hypothetical protein